MSEWYQKLVVSGRVHVLINVHNAIVYHKGQHPKIPKGETLNKYYVYVAMQVYPRVMQCPGPRFRDSGNYSSCLGSAEDQGVPLYKLGSR